MLLKVQVCKWLLLKKLKTKEAWFYQKLVFIIVDYGLKKVFYCYMFSIYRYWEFLYEVTREFGNVVVSVFLKKLNFLLKNKFFIKN